MTRNLGNGFPTHSAPYLVTLQGNLVCCTVISMWSWSSLSSHISCSVKCSAQYWLISWSRSRSHISFVYTDHHHTGTSLYRDPIPTTRPTPRGHVQTCLDWGYLTTGLIQRNPSSSFYYYVVAIYCKSKSNIADMCGKQVEMFMISVWGDMEVFKTFKKW